VLLQLDRVVKRYRRGTEQVLALDGIDLSVEAGESVAVVGPSGSGKSTLLHLAGGLEVPDAGTVRIDGRDVAGLSLRDRARMRRRDVGFVFQFFHLMPSLSVAENVELPLLLDGSGGGRRRARTRRVRELLDRVGVAERADHLPGELSGGEMQRAAIARAMVAGPRLLLADEPTGNLDSGTGATVLDLLYGLVADDGTALVMVTHDEAAAARAGRVLHVRDGRLAAPVDDGEAGPAAPHPDGSHRAGSARSADSAGAAGPDAATGPGPATGGG
jgi:predicted ABC-type transport system involved in lysophospholipase L1 biosynthesis ATPase subunit